MPSRPAVALFAAVSIAAALPGGAPGAGAAAHHSESASRLDIVETAQGAGVFQTLVAAVGAAGLVETLKSDGPFTVFAPTDEAFAQLPAGTLDALLEPRNREALRAILTYHVVAGEVPASAAGSRSFANTVNGQRAELRVAEGRLRVDDAIVLTADVRASNGLIHGIDRVLLPEDQTIVGVASRAGTFATLLAAAEAAGFAETLSGDGPFTVFAPTDEAFARLPEGTVEELLGEPGLGTLKSILGYHVLEGRVFADGALAAGRARTVNGESVAIRIADGRLRVNGAAVAAADVEAANGVVHVIEEVLLPPEARGASARASAESEERMRVAGSARRVIDLAIRRGVPLFNAGDAAACAAVYEVAATSLLEGDYKLPAAAAQSLESGLREASRMDDSRARAWALRYALDGVFAALGDEMTARGH